MNYEFPIIRNINDVLPAIQGRDEFVVADKGSYTVINYNVMMADSFDCNVRRECRGIIFDTETGDIIRRPFHKFFNVNEREETQLHNLDFLKEHWIDTKLDGSMIAPFYANGQMIWGTKMGATDVAKPVEEFVNNNPQYVDLADYLINYGDGWTPIFEWCSRKQRIVLDYAEDQLVLIAIRNMKTGVYSSFRNVQKHGEEHNIPVVEQHGSVEDPKAFMQYVHELKNAEGFVIRWADGHRVKIKAHEYIQIHKAKEAILQDRNIVELILEEHLDDIKAHLPEEDRFELSRFEHLFNIEVYGQAQLISNMVEHMREENVDRKTFALEIGPKFDQYTRAAIFRCWDETDDRKIVDYVRNTIRNNLTKTVKYEAIRDAWFKGVIYNA